MVEVAGDGLFEAGGGYGELEGVAGVVLLQEAVDEAAGEGVAAAYAVHDLEVPAEV